MKKPIRVLLVDDHDVLYRPGTERRLRPLDRHPGGSVLPGRDRPWEIAIGWVSELIGIAGGDDVFPTRAAASLARERIVADPAEVVRAAPDIIVGSWCGKKFRPEKVAARAGWADLPAVRAGRLHEIKSCDILQPGPAALTDGVEQLHRLCAQWAAAGGGATPTRP